MTVHHKILIKFLFTIKSIHSPTGLDRGFRSACCLSAMAQWREILLLTHHWIIVSPARTGPVLPTRHWIVVTPARTGPVRLTDASLSSTKRVLSCALVRALVWFICVDFSSPFQVPFANSSQVRVLLIPRWNKIYLKAKEVNACDFLTKIIWICVIDLFMPMLNRQRLDKRQSLFLQSLCCHFPPLPPSPIL